MRSSSEHTRLLGGTIDRVRPNENNNDGDQTKATVTHLTTRAHQVSHGIVEHPATRQLLSLILAVFFFLLPSFIRSLFEKRVSIKKSSLKISSLDGLRGFACVGVMTYHWACAMGDRMSTWALESDPEKARHPATNSIQWWPIVYNLWNGTGMVYVFFVISGYVLSYKAVSLIRSPSSSKEGLRTYLASAIFRRGLRLYAPCMAVFLVIGIACQLGIFTKGIELYEQSQGNERLPKYNLPVVPVMDRFGKQMWDVFCECAVLFSTLIPWTLSYAETNKLLLPKYEEVVWTIPIEFRGSMLVFVFLLGTSGLCARYRVTIYIASTLYALAMHELDVFLFLSGMTLAEVDCARRESRDSSPTLPSTNQAMPVQSPVSHNTDDDKSSVNFKYATLRTGALYGLLYLSGLYLLSAAVGQQTSRPGYAWLRQVVQAVFFSSTTDPGAKLQAMGAVIIVWSTVNFSLVAPLFTNPVSHYLGQISFSLYLVHCSVFKAVGFVVIPWAYWVTSGVEEVSSAEAEPVTSGQIAKAWALAYAVNLPVILWLADLFWRAVDQPSVRLARWLERRLSSGR